MIEQFLYGMGAGAMFVLGWFARQVTMFRNSHAAAPSAAYEVRLVRSSQLGEFVKPVYAGPDLAAAKAAYFAKQRCRSGMLVQLFTAGNHTASRQC